MTDADIVVELVDRYGGNVDAQRDAVRRFFQVRGARARIAAKRAAEVERHMNAMRAIEAEMATDDPCRHEIVQTNSGPYARDRTCEICGKEI